MGSVHQSRDHVSQGNLTEMVLCRCPLAGGSILLLSAGLGPPCGSTSSGIWHFPSSREARREDGGTHIRRIQGRSVPGVTSPLSNVCCPGIIFPLHSSHLNGGHHCLAGHRKSVTLTSARECPLLGVGEIVENKAE